MHNGLSEMGCWAAAKVRNSAVKCAVIADWTGQFLWLAAENGFFQVLLSIFNEKNINLVKNIIKL